MRNRNTSASHSLPRLMVDAMVHTGELKNTSTVNNITGSARTSMAPIDARLARVMRAAQPNTDPTPVAVHTNIVAMTMASRIMSTSTRGLGPPNKPPITATTSDTAEAVARCWVETMRDTSQPTTPAAGKTSTKMASTNHSVRVGVPSMSIVCLPVRATVAAEHAAITANAARAGAERVHTRCTSAPGRSTAGNPR